MQKAKAPDARCTLFVIGGPTLRAKRCAKPACGWDALKRRACRVHMPAKLLPKLTPNK